MAQICDDWVGLGIINARSTLADARLDYGEPFKYEYTPSKEGTCATNEEPAYDEGTRETDKEQGYDDGTSRTAG